jgi:hypothetical protein
MEMLLTKMAILTLPAQMVEQVNLALRAVQLVVDLAVRLVVYLAVHLVIYLAARLVERVSKARVVYSV